MKRNSCLCKNMPDKPHAITFLLVLAWTISNFVYGTTWMDFKR